MSEPNEEGVVSGLLPFTVNGETRHVPELKWRANREWQARLQETFDSLAAVPSDTPDGIRAMADAERSLVLAYDATGALGDLEDATEREIDAIYDGLMVVSFPQSQSRTALMVALVRQAVASVQENSTNGPSPTGASEVPTTLRPRLPTAKSSSSTPRRRSA